MQLLTARVITNTEIAARYHELTIPWESDPPLPGQFLTLRVGDGSDPLLRRPFAFSRHEPESGRASLIYERRGKVTCALAALDEGDELSILGPLGHPFPLPHANAAPVLVSGGVGIGPIIFLAHAFSTTHSETVGVYGARSASALPMDQISQAGTDSILCTDDGTAGIKGTVVDGLSSLPKAKLQELFVCGPNPMMKAVSNFARERELRCWVSMEQVMGCAVGACMGCVVRTAKDNGFERVCTEGPIFDATQIVW